MNKEILDKIVSEWSKLTPEQKVSELDAIKGTEWHRLMCELYEFDELEEEHGKS